MKISVFDIPLLKDRVTQYLSPQDLSRCVLVSRSWFDWFTPPLWRTVDYANCKIISPEGLAALTRHQDFVQTILAFHKYLPCRPVSHKPPRNLQTLEHSPSWTTLDGDLTLLNLVKAMPTLKSLTLTLTLSNEEVHKRLIDTLFSLPRLHKFDLTCHYKTSSNTIQQVIRACSRFEYLRLSLGGMMPTGTCLDDCDNDPEQYNIAKRAMDQMPDTQIRELSICLSHAKQEPILLIPLLERCPLLTKLDLEWLRDRRTLGWVAEVLERQSFSQLKHVRLGALEDHGAKDEEIAGLINALRLVRSNLMVRSCSDNSDHDHVSMKGGLETFEVEAILPFEKHSVQSLIRCHAATLTVLDLMSLRQLKCQLFVDLMGSLPKLRTVMAPVWLGHTQDTDPSAFETPWMCVGIKDLELGLQLTGAASDHQAGSGSLTDQYIRYMFTQIGRLTELEEWKLVSWTELINVGVGYLDLLAGLKRLKCLDLRRCPNNRLDVKEAEWMLEHWTSLIQLFLYRGRKRSARYIDMPHHHVKETLLSKRPWMRIE
ncbi:hypothetical protein BGX34_009702 [Mortierella sp. NVP85]|nr:hypothetical protein BGX34_009702 [Mortierella sp. NVP85]